MYPRNVLITGDKENKHGSRYQGGEDYGGIR